MHPSSIGFSGDVNMLLSTGINFLLNENLNAAYNKYANELLETFLKHFYEMYGYDQAI
jgi:hypothetical protein